MRLLDYTVPLGGADVDSDVHSLLDKIESVSWDAIPRQNSSRSFTHQRPSFSSGRTHRAAGDFAWFNPWSGSLCSAAEAQLSRRFGNQVPLPATEPVIHTDPQASNICTRPSPPSSPRLCVLPAAPPVAPTTPATSTVRPVSPAVPSIDLRSQLVHPPPSPPARTPAPAFSLEVKSPEPEVTERLSVRAISESGGNQPLFLSLQNVTSNQHRAKQLLRLPKIPKNLVLLLRRTLPSCRLMASRQTPSKRLRWRTSESSPDSLHLSRKVNPSSYRRGKSPPFPVSQCGASSG